MEAHKGKSAQGRRGPFMRLRDSDMSVSGSLSCCGALMECAKDRPWRDAVAQHDGSWRDRVCRVIFVNLRL